MPFKDKEKKRQYDKQYSKDWYTKNKQKKLKYQMSRKEKNREAWRKWKRKQQDRARKEAMRGGFIYRSRKPYSPK